jgi:hypothetical protein
MAKFTSRQMRALAVEVQRNGKRRRLKPMGCAAPGSVTLRKKPAAAAAAAAERCLMTI